MPARSAFPAAASSPRIPIPSSPRCARRRRRSGWRPSTVEIVGRLDLYRTRTGFEVTPVVGLVRPPLSLTLDAFEVAEAFEVPLGFVLDPVNHELHTRELRGRMRTFYVLPYEGRYIWGATAGMLVNLAQVLRP